MKYYFLFFLATFSMYVTKAQNLTNEQISKRFEGTIKEVIIYDEVEGTPFRYDDYKKGEVYLKSNNDSIIYEINYNAFEDRMEYMENKITYTVTNPNQINTIIINNDVFVYKDFHNYNLIDQGYFLEIINDYISLYKRVLKEKSTSTNVAYTRTHNVEGIFYNLTPLYYISIYGDPLVLIKSKRKLKNLFFNNPAVVTFLKEENINLHSEEDLIKLVTFLNNYDKKKMN